MIVWNQIRDHRAVTTTSFSIAHNIRNCHCTHMGWHLCSGSDSDSLEASPLCRDIHWLGCGSPVADDKPNRNSVESFWVNSADNSDKLVNARTSSFTGVVASNNIKAQNMHGDQRSSLQRVLCARFITTALLCFHCHLSNLMYCNALGWRFFLLLHCLTVCAWARPNKKKRWLISF